MTMHTFLKYNEVIQLLETEGGLRTREARLVLQNRLLEPCQHNLHSQRLWNRQTVLKYCESVRGEVVETS